MGLLADLIVQFSVKGVSVIKTALADVQSTAKATAAAVTKVGQVASLSLSAYATASLAGTIQGHQFLIAQQMLSREIAGIFTPALEKATEAVRTLTGWFSRLTGEQQDNIQRWASGAIAAATFAKVLTSFIPGVGPVVTLLSSLGVGALVTQMGFDGLGKAIGSVVGEIGKVFDALAGAFAPVAEAVGNVVEELAKMAGSAIKDALPDLIAAAQALAPALLDIVGIVGDLAKIGLGDLLGTVKGMASIIHVVADGFAEAWKWAQDLAETMGDVMGTFQGLNELIQDVVGGALADMLEIARQVLEVFREIRGTLEKTGVLKTRVEKDRGGGGGDFDFGPGKPHRVGTPAQTGTEGLTATFDRIQAAVAMLGQGKPVEEKQLDALEKIDGRLEENNALLRGLRPGLAR